MQTVEQTGLIGPLTRHVLERSIAECAAWRKDGRELSVAVNLSVRNLRRPRSPEGDRAPADDLRLPADALQLEITESMIMSDPERALATVTRLSDLGVRLSVDDFGTGYSSLANLRRLPIDELKIDRSFVSPMLHDESDLIIVRSTINLGHDLGLTVIAEGVEDSATLHAARAAGLRSRPGLPRQPADAGRRVRRVAALREHRPRRRPPSPRRRAASIDPGARRAAGRRRAARRGGGRSGGLEERFLRICRRRREALGAVVARVVDGHPDRRHRGAGGGQPGQDLAQVIGAESRCRATPARRRERGSPASGRAAPRSPSWPRSSGSCRSAACRRRGACQIDHSPANANSAAVVARDVKRLLGRGRVGLGCHS